jgi:hypothetical protein
VLYKPTEDEIDMMNTLHAAYIKIDKLERELERAKEDYEILKYAFESGCLTK